MVVWEMSGEYNLGENMSDVEAASFDLMAVMASIAPEEHRVLAATQVLGFLCEANQPLPGSFTCLLIDAAFHADAHNLRQLAAGFPGIAWAVYLYKYAETGRAELFELVGAQV
jgi:hypothetical protein